MKLASMLTLFLVSYFHVWGQNGELLFPKKDHFISTDTFFTITPEVKDFTPVDFRLINKPASANFDQGKGTLTWQTSLADLGAYFITFIAKDTSDQEISQVIYVNVEEQEYAPSLVFLEKNFAIDVQPIEVRERLDTVRFKIRAKDNNLGDKVRFLLKVNDRSTPPFKHYSLEILDNLLLFEWIPCNESARQTSFHFEIEAFDESGLSDQLTLNFLVEDINFPPEILNQRFDYEILPDETTTINIRAKDWDQDKLLYKILNPGLSQSYFNLDEKNGFLTVNIPSRNIQEVINGSVDLRIRVEEMADPSKYDERVFQLRQSQVNIAPEVVMSSTSFEVLEGQSFVYQLRVFDANGNQNLQAKLRNPPEGLSLTRTQGNSYELKWDVGFDYLKDNSRDEQRLTFRTEIIAFDGNLESAPRKIQITVLNQEDPQQLKDDFFRWKSATTEFVRSMNLKSTQLDRKSVERRRSNKWLGFLAASVGAFGGLSASTNNGTALNNVAPFLIFSSAIATGYVALRVPPASYSAVSSELKRMQTELKSSQDALERLSGERLDGAFKRELGKAEDLLKRSKNTWVIQYYPQYADLFNVEGPEVEFSKDTEQSITYTK